MTEDQDILSDGTIQHIRKEVGLSPDGTKWMHKDGSMAEEKRIPTSEKLAQALREANAPLDMISRAEAGYYDDFRSELAFPMRQLVLDAVAHELPQIAMAAIDGQFDAQSWEADEWAKSEEGQETFKKYMKGK